jgi:hypothetical protein
MKKHLWFLYNKQSDRLITGGIDFPYPLSFKTKRDANIFRKRLPYGEIFCKGIVVVRFEKS